MKRQITSVLLSLFIASSAFGEVKDDIKTYKKEGKVIMDMILKKEIDVDKVKKSAIAMTNAAAELAKTYVIKHPKGKKMIDMALDKLDTIKKSSFEEIEKQWHDLEFFKGKEIGIDMTDEDNEHFTDPLHSMLHPILTLRAAEAYAKSKDEKNIQTMKEELSEGLEQMEGLSEKLK